MGSFRGGSARIDTDRGVQGSLGIVLFPETPTASICPFPMWFGRFAIDRGVQGNLGLVLFPETPHGFHLSFSDVVRQILG